ncbi:MAG: glycosyl hydrolase-related protein, partial [bacterium]
RTLIFNSAHHIVKEKEEGDEVCVAVFNPYTWTVTDWVEAELELGKGWRGEPGIMLHGKEIAGELLELKRRKDGSISKIKIGFIATERPMNHQVFQICKKKKTFESKIEVAGNEVLTKFFNLKIDEKSGILQVCAKNGVKLLEGNEIIIDQELGDLYFHRHQLDEYIGSESGKGIRFGIFKAEGLSIDKGPLKTTITFKSTFYCLRWPYYLTEKFGTLLHRQKTLDLVKKVTVYEDLPRIDFETYLNLCQTHVRIRLKFDTCMITPEYWRQTQFGALEISPQKIFEEGVNVPAPDWVTAQEGGRGIAFMTLGVPVNEIRAGEIYYTLLRSVSVLSADGMSGPLIPTPGALEIGEHTYKYSIYPYQGDWQEAGIYKSAVKFEQSLLPVQINSSVNKKYESFSLTPDNLIISALKKAEDDGGIILRFFETKGEKCRGVLKVPTQIRKVMLANLLEIEEKEVRIDDNTLELDVGPFEIVSLKLFTEQ